MNAFLDLVQQHGSAVLGGSGAMVLFVAWARHIPTWPLSTEKLWEWFRGTAQEVASQRSGQQPPGLPQPPLQAVPLDAPVDPAQPTK